MKRDKRVQVLLTIKEKEILESKASKKGLKLSTYLRQIMLNSK